MILPSALVELPISCNAEERTKSAGAVTFTLYWLSFKESKYPINPCKFNTKLSDSIFVPEGEKGSSFPIPPSFSSSNVSLTQYVILSIAYHLQQSKYLHRFLQQIVPFL